MIYLMLSIFIAILSIVYMVYVAHHDTIDYRRIYDEKLPHGFNNFRIFFISDIHRRKISENTLQSIKEKLDIVIIGGDLTEKGVPLIRTKNNLKKLKQWGIPLYFVWGNNDYEGIPNMLYDLLMEEDVIILANSNKEIVAGNGDKLSLLGLDCCQNQEARLDLAVHNAKSAYFILVTHAPSAFYNLEEDEQQLIHTVLAGHTHGGQIRILGFGFYRRGGFQLFRGTNVFVSEGYGYTRLPFRLGTKAECHVITFQNMVE